MARAATVILITSVLVVLASFAAQPPNLEKALEAQRQLVGEQPYDPQAYNDLGNLLLVAGRPAEAEQAYRRAVELDSGNTAARFNLAILMQQSGRDEEAERELQSLLEIDPYHAWGHYQLGVRLQQRGDRSKALEHYARAFAYDPALTFPENNPHIIDNRLSTEALLMAQRYRRPQASAVPRLYANPDRIVDLMLDEKDAEEGGMEEDGEPAADAMGSGERRERRGDTRLPSNAGGGSEDDDTTEPRAEEDEEEDSEPPRRVLTPASLEGGTRNRAGASSPPPTGTSGRSQDREALRQAFEDRFKAARERAQTMQPSTGGSPSAADSPSRAEPSATDTTRRPRYIPGRRSTGRLELELRLPSAPPAERHAAAGSGDEPLASAS